MWLRYGEFCEAMGLQEDADSFSLWLVTHTLPPDLAARTVEKRRTDLPREQG